MKSSLLATHFSSPASSVNGADQVEPSAKVAIPVRRPWDNVVVARVYSRQPDFGVGWDSTLLDRLQSPLTRFHD